LFCEMGVSGCDRLSGDGLPTESACMQSRCRCGGGEPSPGADVAGVSPVLV
jgi:hypothetical protein